MDKIKIVTPDKPIIDKHARQTAWKKRNPDKVRAYHRQYERDRRKALRMTASDRKRFTMRST